MYSDTIGLKKRIQYYNMDTTETELWFFDCFGCKKAGHFDDCVFLPVYHHKKDQPFHLDCVPLSEEERYKSRKETSGKIAYLITFTIDPKKNVSKEEFEKRVKYEMLRKNIIDYSYIYETGENENLHAHAKVLSAIYIKPSQYFKTYIKKIGRVDVKRITTDNGVLEYFATGEVHSKN